MYMLTLLSFDLTFVLNISLAHPVTQYTHGKVFDYCHWDFRVICFLGNNGRKVEGTHIKSNVIGTKNSLNVWVCSCCCCCIFFSNYPLSMKTNVYERFAHMLHLCFLLSDFWNEETNWINMDRSWSKIQIKCKKILQFKWFLVNQNMTQISNHFLAKFAHFVTSVREKSFRSIPVLHYVKRISLFHFHVFPCISCIKEYPHGG